MPLFSVNTYLKQSFPSFGESACSIFKMLIPEMSVAYHSSHLSISIPLCCFSWAFALQCSVVRDIGLE